MRIRRKVCEVQRAAVSERQPSSEIRVPSCPEQASSARVSSRQVLKVSSNTGAEGVLDTLTGGTGGAAFCTGGCGF